ncbi:MAG: aldose 1-epimerase [Phycisphaerales bacterium]|nr:aldose 1-epimerase [Phycisphaerales bacterium]
MDAPCVLLDERSQSRLTIEPHFGCVATSWIVAGNERLALPAPREQFLASVRTGGIPLLYPYANRLRSDRCEVAGKQVDLTESHALKRDSNQLPIHGLLLRWPHWKLSQAGENCFEAAMNWHDFPELMRVYPFAHTLRLRWILGGDRPTATLAVTTIIEANAGCAVPIAFGWHPYLAVDLATTATIALPRRVPIALDEQGLPQRGARRGAVVARSSENVGANQDTLSQLELSAGEGEFNGATLANGTARTQIAFSTGYRFMQVYSPAGAPFVCIEPMAAATSALCDGCQTVAAGESFAATFTLHSGGVGSALLA